MVLLALLATVLLAGSWSNDLNNDLDNYLPVVPQPILGNLSDVRFLLWTRSNPGNHDYFRLVPGNLDNLDHSPLNASLPTYFIYHGFNDFGECGWIIDSKTELLELYQCNVISVDWQALVPSPWYNFAVENVYLTANYTARFIDWLHSVRSLQPSRIHITGHSLGAHTAGLTAKYVTSGTIARVTGLDPAGPLFYDKPSNDRIDSSDASFVDVLHTNSGSIVEGCIGLFGPVGDVDFYPNGGMHQPGCVIQPVNQLGDWIELFGGCSHARVTALWVESIAALTGNHTFTSWPCSDWDTFFTGGCPTCAQGCLDMGFHVNHSLRGSYYLRTNPTSPYALGDNQ